MSRRRPEDDRILDDTVAALEAPPPAVPAAPVPSPAVAPSPDLAALASLIASAIQQGTAGALDAAQPAKRSREQWEYEDKSAYNPAGELHRPRPALDCPVFWGALDERDPHAPPAPIYDFDPKQCTYDEIVALNGLQPGKGEIKMHDGTREPVLVYIQRDLVTGEAVRKVVALRKSCFEKGKRNTIPNIRVIAAALAPVAA